MKTIPFGSLNYEFINGFDLYLRRRKLATNTRSVHHKNLKMFINLAIKSGIAIINPYRDFKVVREQTERVFLTSQELTRFLEIYRSSELSPELQDVLRYFLFSCFTGLRISDIQVVTHENIIDNYLVIVPVKTRNRRKIIKIFLGDTARSFIKTTSGKLFRTITDQATNRALKEIARCAGVHKYVTYHVARHTFATQFLASGGKVEVLRELLGHRGIDTTMIYVHLVDESHRQQINQLNKQYEEITALPS